MAVEMHVPNKQYDGYYGGVRFHKGVGVFKDVELAKELAGRYGYEIVEIEEEKVEVKAEEVKEEAEKPAPKKRTRKKAATKAGE
ncbi:hypothetical protein ACM5ME_17895 [Bacillus subtilis]|uniref:hypothetical protein n=1 Tax=Bacillus subtilis group TaxID=653685 RepID=UPI002282AC05|nr:hypothetical protein [Bacillus licheniformis]MCY8256455.1 hypothetical protein [Bacillus spizizenii]MDE1381193.1 hypothetical protein [Bacillus licheniformis]